MLWAVMSSPALQRALVLLSRNSPPGTVRNPQPAKELTLPPGPGRKGFVMSRSVAKVSHRRSEVTPARWPGRYPTPEEEQPGLQRPMQGTTRTTPGGGGPSQIPEATTDHVFSLEPQNGSFLCVVFFFPPLLLSFWHEGERCSVCTDGKEKGREGCFTSDITSTE